MPVTGKLAGSAALTILAPSISINLCARSAFFSTNPLATFAVPGSIT